MQPKEGPGREATSFPLIRRLDKKTQQHLAATRAIDMRDWERVFEHLRSEPRAWRTRARMFLHATDALIAAYQPAVDRATDHAVSPKDQQPPSPEDLDTVLLQQVILFLQSVAIQNFLKCIAIANDPQRLLECHNLRELAERAGVQLDEHQLGLLDELSAIIRWNSRYPVPQRCNDYLPWDGLSKWIPGTPDSGLLSELEQLLSIISKRCDEALDERQRGDGGG